ncbi:galactosylceramide sulfotransferase-like isoform X2 [Branchiostoma lanceolatum]
MIRKEFRPVGQGQVSHLVLHNSSDSKKEHDTPKVESRKELPLVVDGAKRTGLLTPGQKETLSSKDKLTYQPHHLGRNSTSKYEHSEHEKKPLGSNVETEKTLDNHAVKINKQFSALNVTAYAGSNESVNALPMPAKSKRSPLPVIEDGIEIVHAESYQQTHGDVCAPKKHFVWIKVHKAGSQTTNPIFERFAYKHHLKLLFGISNGPTVYWPHSPRGGLYVQTRKGGLFDALYVHSRYNKTWMRAHFPNDTVYLAIVKDPFSHFKSSFHYYRLQQHLNLQDSWNPIKMFLKNPWKYKTEALYQGIRFDKTRNAQLFDLGFPVEKSHDMIWAEEYIKQLDMDFLLVIILEHYAESLVLMKRLMCWELLDILLVEDRLNSRNYRYKHYRPTQEELVRYKQYAEAEYAMYERFNKSLWNKISQQSQDFFQEVEHYKQVTKRVRDFCNANSTKELVISASPWNPQYKMRQSTCTYLKIHDYEWRKYSWAQLRYPPRIKRPLRLEYYNNISKYHDKLLAAARNDSAEMGRS